MKIFALLLALTILSFVKGDDIADNAIADGDDIQLEAEVADGESNMNVESAGEELDSETATADIAKEGRSRAKSTHLHITFRNKYTAEKSDTRHREHTKKTPFEFWTDKIKPNMMKQKILPLDGSKDLVSLVVDMKRHIKIDCNFSSRNVKKMVD